MTRIFRSVGFVLALATVGLGARRVRLVGRCHGAARKSGGFTPAPARAGSSASSRASLLPPRPRPTSPTSTSGRPPKAARPTTPRRSTRTTRCGRPTSPGHRSPERDLGEWVPGLHELGRGLCGHGGHALSSRTCGSSPPALRAGNVSPAGGVPRRRRPERLVRAVANGVPCYVNAMVLSPGRPRLWRAPSSALDRLREREDGSAVVPAVHRHGGGGPGHAWPTRSLALAASETQVSSAQRQTRRRIPRPAGVRHQRVRQQRACTRAPRW